MSTALQGGTPTWGQTGTTVVGSPGALANVTEAIGVTEALGATGTLVAALGVRVTAIALNTALGTLGTDVTGHGGAGRLGGAAAGGEAGSAAYLINQSSDGFHSWELLLLPPYPSTSSS